MQHSEFQLTGWHVFSVFAVGFGTIIAVNITLAWNAVQTFPGLETRNSYVASQSFQRDRAAQTALDWDVTAHLDGDNVILKIEQYGTPISPEITSAVFGRATTVSADQIPEFAFRDGAFIAPVQAGAGNWNLRLTARASDGTRFHQRIIVEANAPEPNS